MLIIYCDKCGARIAEGDAQSKVVVGYHSVAYCAKCAPVQSTAARPASPPQGVGRTRIITKSQKPVSKPPVHGHVVEEKKPVSLLLYVGVPLVIIAVLVAFMSKRRSKDDGVAIPKNVPVDTPVITPAKTEEKKTQPAETGNAKPGGLFASMDPGKIDNSPDAKIRAAQRRLDEAKAFRARIGRDTLEYRDMLEVAAGYRDTPAGTEAANLIAGIKLPAIDENSSAKGQAIDLLALIDVQRDTVKGEWKKEGGELNSNNVTNARIKLPWNPPEEYDLRVSFTRKKNGPDIVVILPRGDQSMMLLMGGWNNTITGFEKINGKRANDNPTTVKQTLPVDKKFDLVLQVRRQTVRAFVNGTFLTEYRSELGKTALNDDWVLPAGSLAVGSHVSSTTFHSIQAIPVK